MALKGTTIGSGDTTLYTAAAEVSVGIRICNFDSSNADVFTLHVIPTGESKTNSNMLINALSLSAKESVEPLTSRIVLAAGDSIVAFATTGARLTAIIDTIAMQG